MRGLLGDFDGDLSNDLRTPSDRILLPTSSSEEIYRNFGLLCNVDINSNMSLLICIIESKQTNYKGLYFRDDIQGRVSIYLQRWDYLQRFSKPQFRSNLWDSLRSSGRCSRGVWGWQRMHIWLCCVGIPGACYRNQAENTDVHVFSWRISST